MYVFIISEKMRINTIISITKNTIEKEKLNKNSLRNPSEGYI